MVYLSKHAFKNWLSIGLTAALLGSALADQVAAPFIVTVNLQPAQAQSAYCTKQNPAGSFGATVTVVCSTGALVALSAPTTGGRPWTPMHGGAYQYVSYLSRAGSGYRYFDAFTTSGTITTWRQVLLHDRSYTELMVSW